MRVALHIRPIAGKAFVSWEGGQAGNALRFLLFIFVSFLDQQLHHHFRMQLSEAYLGFFVLNVIVSTPFYIIS